MSSLEDRYRRLLAWYPRDHRAAHEDEMVGVLLASAAPGQTRPGLGDRADLLWGGLKLHTRRAFGRTSAPDWRDALALTGVAGTLAVLIQVLTTTVDAAASGFWVAWPFVQLPLIVAVAAGVLLNQRWVAAPAAWLLFAYMTPWTLMTSAPLVGQVVLDAWVLVVLGTAVALTLTRTPRYGLRLAGPRRLLQLTALLVAVQLWEASMYWLRATPDSLIVLLPVFVVYAIACGYALSSSLGRRCLAILALPVAGGLASTEVLLFQGSGWLPAVLLGLALVPFAWAGRSISRRGRADGGGEGVAAGGRA
jgi:hypothetical protein